jgi:hypothetical protein
VAIEEVATQVRIGTAVFGTRPPGGQGEPHRPPARDAAVSR